MLLKIIYNVAFIKVVGAAIFFILQLVLARMLGPKGVGIYLLITMVATIAATVNRLGMENPLLRLVATFSARAKWSEVKSIYKVCVKAILLSSTLCSICILLYISSEDILHLHLGIKMLWVIPLLFMISLAIMQSQALLGVGMSYAGSLVQQVIPMGVALLISPLMIYVWGVDGAVFSSLIGWTTAYSVGLLFWIKKIPEYPHDLYRESFPFSTIWRSSSPLIIATVITQLNQWMIIGMSSIWLSHEVVGQLGVAQRTAMMVSFILGAINIVTNPKYAVLHNRKKFHIMGKLARNMSLLMMIISIPIFLLATFFSEAIMSAFGDGFSEASTPFVILMFGQLVNALCGSVGFILMMSGFEADVRNAAAWTFFVSFVAHLMLIPTFGIIGAAVSSSFAVIFWNVLMSWKVWIRLGFVPFPISSIKNPA